ncbi:MAG TPA: glycosyltransferase [Clostridiales bacterium]|nr:glycosyltransferase [Clostridiales bacterium]HQP69987.1 glycosyltransferase [Clostridiales bacterium]
MNLPDIKKINIAFYTLDFKTSGVFKIISTLSQNIPSDYNLHIFVSDEHDENFIPAFKVAGEIHYFNIKGPSSRNPLKKMYKNYMRKKLLKKYKSDYNIDLTVTFSENPNLHNIVTRQNDKIVICVHNYTSINIAEDIKNRLYSFMYNRLIKKYFNRADKIVTVSSGIKTDLVSNFGMNKDLIEVLYNPHDIKRIEEMSDKELPAEYKYIFENRFSIINIGRISTQKGHWHLIRAFKTVKQQIPEAILIIIGEGKKELTDLLSTLISDLELSKDVVFLNFQTNPYVFMKNADIYAASSIFEGLPNVLIECMACGTPVISTDCRSGPREILAPKTDFSYVTDIIEKTEFGILTPPLGRDILNSSVPITKEETLLAEAMIMLYNDKETRSSYSNKGKLRAAEFNIENTIRNYDRLFKKVLEQ